MVVATGATGDQRGELVLTTESASVCATTKIRTEHDSAAASQSLLGSPPECLPRACAHIMSVTREQGCLNKGQNSLKVLLPNRQILLKIGMESELQQHANSLIQTQGLWFCIYWWLLQAVSNVSQ